MIIINFGMSLYGCMLRGHKRIRSRLDRLYCLNFWFGIWYLLSVHGFLQFLMLHSIIIQFYMHVWIYRVFYYVITSLSLDKTAIFSPIESPFGKLILELIWNIWLLSKSVCTFITMKLMIGCIKNLAKFSQKLILISGARKKIATLKSFYQVLLSYSFFLSSAIYTYFSLQTTRLLSL